MQYYLEFEEPIRLLDEEIHLKESILEKSSELTKEIAFLHENRLKLINKIHSNLTRWQRVQLARHPERPYALDYINFVFSDFKRIIDTKNQRDNTFNYDNDKIFDRSELLQHMQKEINDPSLGHLGLFGCNGRLIKRSVIENGKIRFVEELRFLEDKTFCWDLFGKINNAVYIRRQLYSYYVYPDVQTAITKSINHGLRFINIRHRDTY